MSSFKTLDLEVEAASLRLRVEALESHLFGKVAAYSGPKPLFSVYMHLICDGVQECPESAVLLSSIVLLLTPRSLLDLARVALDPFPWRPFLLALDSLDVAGHDVSAATAHLERCANELMSAQGFQVLRIEDVLLSKMGPLGELRRVVLSE